MDTLPMEITSKVNILYTNKNHTKKPPKSLSESLFYLVKAFLRAKMKDLDSFNKVWPWYLLSVELLLAFISSDRFNA